MPNMDHETFRNVLEREISDAQTWLAGGIRGEQRRNLQYYMGLPLGNEVEGRSQVISWDVFETLESALPNFLEPFFSGDNVGEFLPREPGDVEYADQATDLVNYVVKEENAGFLLFSDWFKDALLSKVGVVRAKWVQPDPKRESFKGLAIEQLAMLMQDPAVEIIDQAPSEQVTPDVAQAADLQMPVLFDVDISRKQRGRVELRGVPPESFVINRKAKRASDIRLIGEFVIYTRSQLKEMGFKSADEVKSYDGANQLGVDEEWLQTSFPADKSLEEIRLFEGFAKVDYNGDGVAEWRRVLMAGDSELENEEVEDHDYAILTPIKLPHRVIGMALADPVAEIQRLGSGLTRQYVDSLYLANNPKTYVNTEAQVNLDDVISNRIGGLIRGKGPATDAVAPIKTALVASESLDGLEMVQAMRERRTGVTRYNQGLDADSLNKMIDVETPVPYADGGYKRLGDVADGDVIVGADGGPVTVTRAHEIQYPRRAYELVFSSGEHIRAGGDHLWTVQTDSDKRIGKTRTVDTDRLSEMVGRLKHVYVPLVARPMTGTKLDLPLDPYLLGVWLGDGDLWAPRITTPEPEIVAYLGEWCAQHGGKLTKDKHQNSGDATTYFVGGLHRPLRAMKLMKRAGDDSNCFKHIPDEYFRASYGQRLALLRGLMDTDGCHHSRSLALFSQSEGRVLDDTVRLVESLGGWPSVRKATWKTAFKMNRPHYQVTFHLADCPFSLPRKCDGWKPPARNGATQVVKSVEPIGSNILMRCLTVDAADGLFCVGRRFTVTHNTATGITKISNLADKRMKMILRAFAETGVKRLFKVVLRLLTQYQDIPMTVRLRGQFVQFDPRMWSPDMDVSTDVGLGTGDHTETLAMLQQFGQFMQVAAQVGLVGPEQVYEFGKALAKNAKLKGADQKFMKDPQQIQQQPPKPTPEMIKAQTDQQVQQSKQQIEIAKLQANATEGDKERALQMAMKQAELSEERWTTLVQLAAGYLMGAQRPGTAPTNMINGTALDQNAQAPTATPQNVAQVATILNALAQQLQAGGQ